MRKNIVLVGLGLHAAHSYLPAIKQMTQAGEVRLIAVVDLECQRQRVLEFLSSAGLTVEDLILLEGAPQGDAPADFTALDRLIERQRVDGIIISTDPRHHLAYLEWAAQRNIDALVDKPITAREMDSTEAAAERLGDDFALVTKLFENSSANATVMVPRRRHAGFQHIHRTVRDAVAELGLPITYLDIYYSSGYWNWPDEFFTRENHPYRYGYGALLHSGYHFIDLAGWLLSLNEATAPGGWADRLEALTQSTTPDDFMEQVPAAFYDRMGLAHNLAAPFSDEFRSNAKHYGETDVNIAFSALRDNKVITLGNVKVLETGLSLRAWQHLPSDTYKGNGKLSQDKMTIHIGHLVAIHAWEEFDDTLGNGGRVFHVEVLRNSRLIGGTDIVRHTFGGTENGKSASLSSAAKLKLLREWLRGEVDDLALSTHHLSIQLLVAAYTCMARRRRGLPPVASVPIGELPTHDFRGASDESAPR